MMSCGIRKLAVQSSRVSATRCCWRYWERFVSMGSGKQETEAETIVVPKRIPRGPTDILKSLASITHRDVTAFHYRFHDDPFLQPTSSFSKRSYALSKEAGRKAAKFIRDTHGELFQHQDSEPFIQAFAPKIHFSEESSVNEEILKDLIDKSFVTDAITVYQLIKEKNLDVSRETLQSLLELVCFYNEQDPIDEDYMEERSYAGSKHSAKLRWKDGGVADGLFERLSPPDRETYEAMIRGLAKYQRADKAWDLYQEMTSKQIIPTVQTFNHLIKTIPFLRDEHQARWVMLQELLVSMYAANVSINVETLNSCLDVLARQSRAKDTTSKALQLLAEFSKLKIEPSLAGYYLLLKIFNTERRSEHGNQSGILYDIMDRMSDRDFFAVEPNDTQFFVTAMDVCRNILQDKNLGYRINDLLQRGRNYKFIGNDLRASAYYRHFMVLLVNTEPIQEFMEVYSQMVPNIYSPEPFVMLEILRSAEVQSAIEYVPQFWADIVMLELNGRINVLESFLNLMSVKIPETNTQLHQHYINIIKLFWKNMEERQERLRGVEPVWSGVLIGEFMKLSCELNLKPQIVAAFSKCVNTPDSVSGIPTLDSLRSLLRFSFENGQKKLAIKLVEYMEDSGFSEASEFAKMCVDHLQLDNEQKYRISHHLVQNSSTSSSSSSDSDETSDKS